jgi:hypothetical protein
MNYNPFPLNFKIWIMNIIGGELRLPPVKFVILYSFLQLLKDGGFGLREFKGERILGVHGSGFGKASYYLKLRFLQMDF